MMLCSNCNSDNWKHEREEIVAESQKWPIKLDLALRRYECSKCGLVWYSADLATDSLYPVEIVGIPKEK